MFAALLCEALGEGAYVSLTKVGDNGSSFVSVGDWAGPKPEQFSRAPYAANAKWAELLLAGKDGVSTGVTTTPTTDFPLGLGWMGGARHNDYIVGVSKWSEEFDRLLALLVLYHLQWETQLHHFGVRFPSHEAMNRASVASGLMAIEMPANDHFRIYHPVASKDGIYYLEEQYFPEGPYDFARHWDLTAKSPDHLLWYVANAFGQVPVLFDDVGPNEPIGVVWIKDKKGNKFGVMAREKWTPVEEW